MGDNTPARWCDHVFDPWRGCAKVSAGCANCWAAARATDNPAMLGLWGRKGTRVIAPPAAWLDPIAWNRRAELDGVRRRVLCANWADVFEDADTLPADALGAIRAARLALFDTIRRTPRLTWLLPTKRPKNIAPVLEHAARDRAGSQAGEWVEAWRRGCPPANVLLGVSVENQPAADARIPPLLAAPSAGRFVIYEPALGPINWSRFPTATDLWIIVGGEVGPYASPFDLTWAHDAIARCRQAAAPCFVKQLGRHPLLADAAASDSWPAGSRFGNHTGIARYDGRFALLRDAAGADPLEWPQSLRVREFPSAAP